MQVEVGKIFDGKVTGITSFGAFVEFGEGKEVKTGLVHISEVAAEYVKNINDHLSINDQVKVKVVSIDEKGKIGLSIKQAVKKPEVSHASRRPANVEWTPKPVDEAASFEDKLNKFKQASEEKMHDLKRSMDVKRGRRNSY